MSDAFWYADRKTQRVLWWTGDRYQESDDPSRTGPLKLAVLGGDGPAHLAVFENEVWKVTGFSAEKTGGSLAGAQAFVDVQSQLQLSMIKRARAIGATILRVSSPAFDFSFILDTKELQTPNNLRLVNECAEMINTRSRQLSPAVMKSDSGASTAASVADELMKLAALRDQGVLTNEEFMEQKARILLG